MPLGEKADASEDGVSADQVATLAIHEKSPLESSFVNDEAANKTEVHEPLELGATDVVVTNGDSGSLESKTKTTTDWKVKENGSFVSAKSSSNNFGHRGHDYSSQKVQHKVQDCVNIEHHYTIFFRRTLGSHMFLHLKFLLLGIGEEDTSLTKAAKSGDTDLVYIVLFHMWHKRPILELFRMIQARSLARDLFICYARSGMQQPVLNSTLLKVMILLCILYTIFARTW